MLHKLSDIAPDLYTSFLLESLNRTVTVFFKLVPFVIGFDEAGAHFVTETLALGIGIGFTLAIIRKGRLLFWSIIGMLFLLQRGLSIGDIIKGAKMIYRAKDSRWRKKINVSCGFLVALPDGRLLPLNVNYLRDIKSCRIYQNSSATLANSDREAATCWFGLNRCSTFEVL